MNKFRVVALAALSSGSLSWGHLDTLRINGTLAGTKGASFTLTDSFTVGQQIPVTFQVMVAHNGTRIYYRLSRDNGTVWDTITSTTTVSAGTRTLLWTVPGPATSRALIRIFHSASPNLEGMVPNDYTLISGQFSIVSASSLRPIDFSRNLSIRQTPNAIQVGGAGINQRLLRVELSDPRGVFLRAGRLAGNGAISIPTSDLSQGMVFVRVLAGDKSLAERALLIRH